MCRAVFLDACSRDLKHTSRRIYAPAGATHTSQRFHHLGRTTTDIDYFPAGLIKELQDLFSTDPKMVAARRFSVVLAVISVGCLIKKLNGRINFGLHLR